MLQTVPKKRGKISEYEITLLWQTFQEFNFPGGRVNKMQLSQMLRKVSELSTVHMGTVIGYRVARWQNLIPSFPWIAPGWRAWGRNLRKGRDQILQRCVAEP